MNEKKILVYGVSEEYYGTIRKLYGEDSTIIDVTGQYQIIFAIHADVIIINTVVVIFIFVKAFNCLNK